MRTLDDETVRGILTGQRPKGANLAGATLDGKVLPAREQEVPWDLSGVNLRGSVLTRLDLSGARFTDADLSGAAFRSVNLSAAAFDGVSAAGAVFEDVNLAYATFREADLRGASFTFANLADIDFKSADLRGTAVNGVRFSLNGGTHSLGLKEALNHRFVSVSYPFCAGVSGDAFWLSYLTETGELSWGGFPGETFRRGLGACGFGSEMVNEFDVEKAWRRMTEELKIGRGVITPLHVGEQWITGAGFGGSEWVYVSRYDPGADAVRVRCILGNDIEYHWDEFVRSWCIRHPQDRRRGDIIYTFCIVGEKTEEKSTGEAVIEGLRSGLEILNIGEFSEQNAVCGIPAYDLLLRDLEAEPSAVDEGCAWLGLGLMHHHGSRWAIRDFLGELDQHVTGVDDEIRQAVGHYQTVLDELRGAVEILPDSISGDSEAARAARGAFLESRDEAGRRLRNARKAEIEAAEILEAIVANASPME